jgi:4-alpha-glucanotransferase
MRSDRSRTCGVLLHPTALPGPGGCGTLGKAAHDWVNLLARSGVGVWQLLPLAPTDSTGSPYSSPSGSALNPWLLDADALVADGFLSQAAYAAVCEGVSPGPGGGGGHDLYHLSFYADNLQ